MSEKRERIAPSVRFVRSLEGQYYLLREAAEMIGVSHRTLRNFIEKDQEKLGPSFYTWLGKIKIYLYTDDDIKRLKTYIDDQKIVVPISENRNPPSSGRPPKWTAEQRKIRQRKFSQVHYYKKMASQHATNGNEIKAKKALRKMREIQKQLKDEDYKVTYAKDSQSG